MFSQCISQKLLWPMLCIVMAGTWPTAAQAGIIEPVSTVVVGVGVTTALASRNGGANPNCYNYDDLKQVAQNYRGDFHFRNEAGPYRQASLAYFPANLQPIHVAENSGRIIRPQSHNFVRFPWGDYPMIRKGDIVSIRGGDKSSAVLAWFTSWTHDALVWDPFHHEVLESMPMEGVKIRRTEDSWQNLVDYAVNRVYEVDGAHAAEDAKNFYAGTRYYPDNVKRDSTDLLGFYKKWADKGDLDSMYCSKLVWKAYKDKGVDLDSNRTSCFLAFQSIPAPMNWGFNYNAWIGVSPDDIYYAGDVLPDFGTSSVADLRTFLSPAIFK